MVAGLCTKRPQRGAALGARHAAAARLASIASMAFVASVAFVAFVAFVTGSAARAEAQPARRIDRVVSLDYAAPASCPPVDVLRARIEARLSNVAIVAGEFEEAKTRATVRIEIRDDVAYARVRIETADGVVERNLSDGSCAQAADASALVLALGLEGGDRHHETKSVVAREDPGAWVPLVAANGGVVMAIGPSVGPFGELGFGVQRRAAGIWLPEFRLAARFSGLGTSEQALGSAQFRLLSATVQGCPLALSAGSVRAAPCVAFEGGSLLASAEGFPDARERHRPYWAAGAGARATWSAGRPFVELQAWAVIPLARDAFSFGGREQVHRTGAVGATASVGIGLFFP